MTVTTAAPQAAPTETNDARQGARADARAVRLDLAGRTRRLDAGCRLLLIQADPGHVDPLAAVAGQRVRDRLRRLPAARGRAADLLGRRKVFLVALAVFLVTSGIGGIANDGSVLIASRFLKGVAAAFTAHPRDCRSSRRASPKAPCATAHWRSTPRRAEPALLGLVLGGVLTEISWRLVFLVPVVIAAATLAGGLRLIPADVRAALGRRDLDPRRREHHRSTPASRVHRRRSARAGWGSACTLLSLVGVATLMALFVAIEQRLEVAAGSVGHPAIRAPGASQPRCDDVRQRVALDAVHCDAYMQDLRGWSALHTGLAFLPTGVLGAWSRRAWRRSSSASASAGDRVRHGADGRRLRPACASRWTRTTGLSCSRRSRWSASASALPMGR